MSFQFWRYMCVERCTFIGATSTCCYNIHGENCDTTAVNAAVAALATITVVVRSRWWQMAERPTDREFEIVSYLFA